MLKGQTIIQEAGNVCLLHQHTAAHSYNNAELHPIQHSHFDGSTSWWISAEQYRMFREFAWPERWSHDSSLIRHFNLSNMHAQMLIRSHVVLFTHFTMSANVTATRQLYVMTRDLDCNKHGHVVLLTSARCDNLGVDFLGFCIIFLRKLSVNSGLRIEGGLRFGALATENVACIFFTYVCMALVAGGPLHGKLLPQTFAGFLKLLAAELFFF
jgi:hypothetical protein